MPDSALGHRYCEHGDAVKTLLVIPILALLALPFVPRRDNGQLPGRPITLQSCDSSGSPGAATCHKPAGTASMPSGDSNVIITNNLVTSTSLIFVQATQVDLTCTVWTTSAGTGNFAVTTDAVCADAITFYWQVINVTP
jgi:hypothetical protein